MGDIKTMFESVGGEFCLPIEQLSQRLDNIDAFIFDWDGVFNPGIKYGDQGSPFAEGDSMGTNLIRLAYWLNHDRKLPISAIITGAVNAGTEYFANRECFDMVIRGFTNKQYSWDIFLKEFNIAPERVMYVFDDVLDIPIASQCGVRFMIRQTASPAFEEYMKARSMCDYITGHKGGEGAVRELCELILKLQGNYEQVIDTRTEYAEEGYLAYLADRKAVTPKFISRT